MTDYVSIADRIYHDKRELLSRGYEGVDAVYLGHREYSDAEEECAPYNMMEFLHHRRIEGVKYYRVHEESHYSMTPIKGNIHLPKN